MQLLVYVVLPHDRNRRTNWDDHTPSSSLDPHIQQRMYQPWPGWACFISHRKPQWRWEALFGAQQGVAGDGTTQYSSHEQPTVPYALIRTVSCEPSTCTVL